MGFFDYIGPILILEFLSAVAGSWYLYKTRDTSIIRYFVWFLWLTITVETSANYAILAFYTDYEYFPFIENTPFKANYWLYNIYSIIAFVMYISLFAGFLKNKRKQKWLHAFTIIYVIAAVLNLIFSDVFFKAHSVFTFFVGTILVMVSIANYYLQLLKSNAILNIHKILPFYISVGALVYHLCFVPFVIYSKYYNSLNPEFAQVYYSILEGTNYFLYSLYIIGFLICSRKKKSY